jgi:hypothetical protein
LISRRATGAVDNHVSSKIEVLFFHGSRQVCYRCFDKLTE